MPGGYHSPHHVATWGMKLHNGPVVWVLSYPTAARAAPWGVVGEPPGGRGTAWRRASTDRRPPRLRRCTIWRASCRGTVPRQRSHASTRVTGELHSPPRGEVAVGSGVRTSPGRGVLSRFDCARNARTTSIE